eukprot:TRINITY_DN44614_c0_g1_i1.p1 TRINITY_DN44614_c0_g1~~TRINITY_DN44614_c0_g1_i1.p1  ORF type:complete len:390 (-),score=127.43 TRINITY_DN44614_c0_g1_i1:71-1240(-)
MEGKTCGSSVAATPSSGSRCKSVPEVPADDADDSSLFLDAQEGDLDSLENGVFHPPARGSDDDAKTSPMDDPKLQPPPPTKADWDGEMRALQKLVEDDTIDDGERVKILHEALLSRVEDTKNQDEHKAMLLRRLDESTKERDRCQAEIQRTNASRSSLETTCRESQQKNSTIAKENERIAEEEQARHTELRDRFEQAIQDVNEKMDAERDVRQQFSKENEELRGKLQKFTETYEAQEQQLAEQRESRGREMEVAQQRLREHEIMCSESKAKTATLEKQNEAFRKSQTVLRNELQAILVKFDEFHEAVKVSNQRHGDCKTEIDDLQAKLQDLEKENADMKENKTVNELMQESQVAQKQRDALDKLCDNLEKENQKHLAQLRKLQQASGKR